MKQPKFKIGDTIYFMEGTIPVKETIAGITTFTGEAIHSNGICQKTEEGETIIEYHVRSRVVKVNENKTYPTKEELRDATFALL